MTSQYQNTSKRVLIVDDNLSLLTVFSKILKINGFFVSTETTLEMGLHNLQNNFYDVVFVDMPIGNYDENHLLNIFKENDIFSKSNIVLFSSVDILKLDIWKKYGLYDYVQKPIKRKALLQVLHNLPPVSSTAHDARDDIAEYATSEDEATPEQLARVEQLQKQIQELESQSNTAHDARDDIAEYATSEDEATPEQLARVEQLQKQIQELESQSNTAHDARDDTNALNTSAQQFASIIDDLRSLKRPFRPKNTIDRRYNDPILTSKKKARYEQKSKMSAGTKKPTKKKSKTAPKPTKKKSKTAPKPTKKKSKTAPKPTKKKSKTAPKPTKKKSKTAPKPTKKKSKTAPKPTKKKSKN